MGRDRAAYMREYRARRKRQEWTDSLDDRLVKAYTRIGDLEEEVRHLKAELAKRPMPDIRPFNSRPFTPVPKK